MKEKIKVIVVSHSKIKNPWEKVQHRDFARAKNVGNLRFCRKPKLDRVTVEGNLVTRIHIEFKKEC